MLLSFKSPTNARGGTRESALSRFSSCFAGYSLVYTAGKTNVCFAAACSLLLTRIAPRFRALTILPHIRISCSLRYTFISLWGGGGTRESALSRFSSCFAGYSLVYTAGKTNVCFAAACSLLLTRIAPRFRALTILPHIRISCSLRYTFMLIQGHVPRSYAHFCASTSGHRPFDIVIIV